MKQSIYFPNAMHRLTRTMATASSSHPTPYDICIVGGGIVGTALAAFLNSRKSTQSLKIALIEGGDLFSEPIRTPGHFSNRVSSITPESAQSLEKIGVWSKIPDDRKKRFNQMEVLDSIGRGKLQFNSDLSKKSPHAIAWIVENSWLKYGVAESVKTSANVTVFNNATVSNIHVSDTIDSKWPQLRLANGTQLVSRLIVGADGANSSVRKAANIDTWGWDYNQHAIVSTLKLKPSTTDGNLTAYQRFLPTGPIALLPLSEDVTSLVWSTTPALASKLKGLSDEDFVTFVNAALRNPIVDLEFLLSEIKTAENGKSTVVVDAAEEASWGLERYLNELRANKQELSSLQDGKCIVTGVAPGSRASFPLRFRMADVCVKDRVALIGDAAHAIHPLAGQGLNLGISDAIALGHITEGALLDGQDIGSIHVLQEFAKERYVPNLGMMTAVDTVGRLFGNESEILSWGRSFGMDFINKFPPLKKIAMKAAAS